MRWALVLLAGVMCAHGALVREVRAHIAKGDLDAAERLVATHRMTYGTTPEAILGLSWVGRGAQAAKQWGRAETIAGETRRLALAEMKKRPLDLDSELPLALGASIEVTAHAMDARGERGEAVAFLMRELDTYRDTSIRTRLQKNIHLLSLEGKPLPPLDIPLWIGERPVPLESLSGKVVLLFFWAHWCGDCKRQGPVLERLLAKYGPKGFTVVAPTQRYGYVAGGEDATAEKETPYIAGILKQHYSWMAPLAVPVSEANFKNYGASTTPTLVITDRAGIVRVYHPGTLDEAELEKYILRLLAT